MFGFICNLELFIMWAEYAGLANERVATKKIHVLVILNHVLTKVQH